MKMRVRQIVTKLRRDSEGSFTLEASLIFPIMFIVTIALILFSLVVYEKVVIFQRAHLIAERAAYTWDNSHKDFETGEFEANEYSTMENGDGLYWRTNYIGEEFISQVFGGGLGGVGGVKTAKAQDKGGEMLPGATINVTPPSSAGFDRKIEVTLTGRLRVPDFVDLITGGDFTVTAAASIKDPVEMIRTTDFIFNYGEQMFGGGNP